MDSTTDQLLARAAIAGDERAFAGLVHRHTHRLYRIAVHLLGNSSDAEDCVQDTWVIAWRSLAGFRGEAAVLTWLCRIATNAALMQLRRRRPTVTLEQAGTIADGHADTDPERMAASRAVRAALARLPDSYRAVIVLREFGGLSYDEVAAVLHITVPATRSRLHRARLMLTQLLEEWR